MVKIYILGLLCDSGEPQGVEEGWGSSNPDGF